MSLEVGYTINPEGIVLGVRGYPLKVRLSFDGYPQVRLRSGWKQIHRLLANEYIPNPDNLPQIDHIDNNKLNYSLTNLEWVTQQENLHRSMDDGLHNWGRTKVRVTHMKTKVSTEFNSQIEAAKAIGGFQSNINHCLSGKRKTCMGYIICLV